MPVVLVHVQGNELRITEVPDADLEFEVERFSDWMLSSGKQYEDYAAAFRGWLRKIPDFER